MRTETRVRFHVKCPLFCLILTEIRSKDNLVTKAITFRLKNQGVGIQILKREEIFLFSTTFRLALGANTYPPIQRVLGIKRPECETDESPPSSDEDKNLWIFHN
jgi:hypothetical protein